MEGMPLSKIAAVNKQVIIGTPGTINKWFTARKLSMTAMTIVVFDEADHILAEGGFKQDSARIIKGIVKLRPNCQVLLFSATFNTTLKEFARKFVTEISGSECNHLFVKKEELSLDSVKQYKVYCPDEVSKIMVIKDKILEMAQKVGQIIIFVLTRTIQKLQGVGLIFSQFPAKDVIVSSLIPCVQVDFELGTHLLAYMATTRNPVVKLSKTKTVVGQQISPEVVFFSSRGPSSLSPTVLKPDIAAPGVNILASWSAASPDILVKNSQNQDHRQDFRIESGTSMSCPHISGIVSLIKAIHPTWSPAAISYFMVMLKLVSCQPNVYHKSS